MGVISKFKISHVKTFLRRITSKNVDDHLKLLFVFFWLVKTDFFGCERTNNKLQVRFGNRSY